MEEIFRSALLVAKVILAAVVAAALIFGCVSGWHRVTVDMQERRAQAEILPRARTYLDTAYPGNDFLLTGGVDGPRYRIEVSSPASPDTCFLLIYAQDSLALIQDTYDTRVQNGRNTAQRLEERYSEAVRERLGDIPGLYFLKSRLCRYSPDATWDYAFSEKGIVPGALTLDGEYDMDTVGREYGYVEVHIQDAPENITTMGALLHLLDMDGRLADAGYYTLSLNLTSGVFAENQLLFQIVGVRPEDLHCDDPLTRLREIWDEQEMRRMEMQRLLMR